jgi:hypothetical protein
LKFKNIDQPHYRRTRYLEDHLKIMLKTLPKTKPSPKTMGILLLFLLSACSSIEMFKENTEFKPYRRYKTFAILNKEVGHQGFNDSFLDAMVSSSLQKEFESMGLVYESENPELIIRYTSNEDLRQREVNNNRYPMWGWRVWDPWMFDPMFNNRFNSVTTRNYQLLQLIVDYVDPQNDKMLMRLTAVSEVTNRKDKIKKLNKSVKAVSNTYKEHLEQLPQQNVMR